MKILTSSHLVGLLELLVSKRQLHDIQKHLEKHTQFAISYKKMNSNSQIELLRIILLRVNAKLLGCPYEETTHDQGNEIRTVLGTKIAFNLMKSVKYKLNWFVWTNFWLQTAHLVFLIYEFKFFKPQSDFEEILVFGLVCSILIYTMCWINGIVHIKVGREVIEVVQSVDTFSSQYPGKLSYLNSLIL